MPRSRSLPLVVCLAAALLASVGCETTPKDESAKAEPKTMPILRDLEGSDPALTAPDVVLINSTEELTHTGSTALANLNPDFATESMVLLALGERPTGGYHGEITSVRRTADTLIVTGIAHRPGPDEMVVQVITYPFHAVMIPKTQNVRVQPRIESK